IEDRFWAYTTPFADLVPYLPTTMLSLRTLKCDVLAGLDAAGPYPFRSPDWLVSGKMGLIQMIGQTGSESPCATGT
ncbi:MAG: damage-control phosphatase ARMT1 family protein, partial [Bacteroidia bacterium]|nr:damage-control phosphatase ARMT1 family protein [Bacteroidia bacterium]